MPSVKVHSVVPSRVISRIPKGSSLFGVPINLLLVTRHKPSGSARPNKATEEHPHLALKRQVLEPLHVHRALALLAGEAE